MKVNQIQIFFLILLFAFNSCNEDDEIQLPLPIEEGNQYVQYGTPFSEVPDVEDIIMYEVNLRAYSSSGDIKGLIEKMDHIEDLGINVIWLMPIHPIGEVNSVNSPYSVRDYKALSSEYGTIEDLRKLTDDAHSRGIAVIMDWVANHTSWDNDWIFNEDWYTQNSSGEIIHPPGTNWMDVADLNYSNQDMRKAMIDAMKYWIYEANIDGFRCDYADGVPFDFWRNAWQILDSIPDRDLIYFAEGTRTNHFSAGFHLNFGWEYYGAIKNVFEGQNVELIFNAHESEYENLATDKHWIRFTTNHDESAWDATPISIFNGIDGALAASVITFFTGGVPLIYGSQEVGTAGNIPFFTSSTINWNNNPEMLESYQKILQFYSSSNPAKIGENVVFQNDDILCLKKNFNNEEVIIIVNSRNTAIDFSLPMELQGIQLNNVMTSLTMTLSDSISLAPYQFYILE